MIASGTRYSFHTDFTPKIQGESKIAITVFAFEVSMSSNPDELDVRAAFSTATIVNANN